jgi:septation ring formation regulator EzrA
MTQPKTINERVDEFRKEIFPPVNIGYDGGYLDAQHRDKYIAWITTTLTTLLEEVEELVKSVKPDFPDEMKKMVDNYDDYMTGIEDAKLKALTFINKLK